mgnify:FL=1
MGKIILATSIASSLYLTVMLKMLHFFNWIKWHPTKFLHVVDDGLTRWVVLFVILAGASALVYLMLMNIRRVPAILLGIIFGLAIAFVAEWIVYDLSAEAKSFKRLSIPFIAIITTATVFIAETAIFHREQIEKGNELPYSTSMIK